jgi:hypothetical protein
MVTSRCHDSWLRDFRRCAICNSRVSEVMQCEVLVARFSQPDESCAEYSLSGDRRE